MDRSGTAIRHWRWETDRDGLAWLTFDKEGESANTFSRERRAKKSGKETNCNKSPRSAKLLLIPCVSWARLTTI